VNSISDKSISIEYKTKNVEENNNQNTGSTSNV